MRLRHGRWQAVLADVTCDALISDPPYSARVHEGQRHGRRPNGATQVASATGNMISTEGLGYGSLSPADVHELVQHWASRTRGWMCFFTSHDLAIDYSTALKVAGRYVFAPIACVQRGMNVRLAGDGPSNWTTWLVVARPRTLAKWGTLQGAYVGSPRDPGLCYERVPGGKPLWLMRAVVRDYSRPGDLICDPYAGGGTTLLAARAEGRRGIGAEMDRERYELAQRNLTQSYTLSLFDAEGTR